MMHIKIYNFQLKDVHGIYNLSKTLAHFFPKPDQYACGIYELLLNAVEHGNLEIGYDEKTSLIRRGAWVEEVSRRLCMGKYAGREVDITLAHDAHECRLTIRDQGNGFHWHDFIGATPDDRRPNGRGLRIAFASQFDAINFNDVGNEVTCVAHYVHQHEAVPELAAA